MTAGLNPVNADALATAICSALSITDAAAKLKWKSIAETLYTHLKTDILITIPTGAIVTAGSAVTQTGPAAPVPLTPA